MIKMNVKLLKVILKRNKHKLTLLRTIIERYIKCGKNISLCFIDYEKASDRANHAKIIECMEPIDIDVKDIDNLDNKINMH